MWNSSTSQVRLTLCGMACHGCDRFHSFGVPNIRNLLIISLAPTSFSTELDKILLTKKRVCLKWDVITDHYMANVHFSVIRGMRCDMRSYPFQPLFHHCGSIRFCFVLNTCVIHTHQEALLNSFINASFPSNFSERFTSPPPSPLLATRDLTKFSRFSEFAYSFFSLNFIVNKCRHIHTINVPLYDLNKCWAHEKRSIIDATNWIISPFESHKSILCS